jgi:5-methylcytosine-specific restriction endonuclease McrA
VRKILSPQQPIVVPLEGAVLAAAPEAPTASSATASVAPQPSTILAFVPPAGIPRGDERRAVIAPLAEDAFKVQFTASRACRDKLRQAQALLRHRVPDGDMGTIVEKALDLLIEQVKKERFATGRKGREASSTNEASATDAPSEGTGAQPSRHIPDAIKRKVFERDGGRCAFVDQRGRRCSETGALEFDHLDGFARTGLHPVDRIRLLCRAHNQHAAETMYGRAFMERARARPRGSELAPGIPGRVEGEERRDGGRNGERIAEDSCARLSGGELVPGRVEQGER